MQVEQLESVLTYMRENSIIAVVHGGCIKNSTGVINKTHNPRSNKTYEEVAANIAGSLRRSGFRHVILLPEDINLPARLKAAKVDLVWLNTGGTQGLGSVAHAASMLELSGVPYIGHHPLNACLLDYKHIFKNTLQSIGIPTAPYMVVHQQQFSGCLTDSQDFIKKFTDYDGLFVVKPVSGRASLNVHCVDRSGLAEAVQEVIAVTGNVVLIEKFLSGLEYTAALGGFVLCRDHQIELLKEAFVFSHIQRLFSKDEMIFTSQDVCPIGVNRFQCLSATSRVGRQLTNIVRCLQHYLNLTACVRVDFRSDEVGKIHVIEANLKPDLKASTAESLSLISAGLSQVGMTYDDLILSLLADRVYQFLSFYRFYAASLLEIEKRILPL